jgi:hypothetical protein
MDAIEQLVVHSNVNPDLIINLLKNAIELERIKQQTADAMRDENKSYDAQINILQGERFLCLFRNYAAMN